eukprot:64650-Chlamydomonas_euryale.AAC.4
MEWELRATETIDAPLKHAIPSRPSAAGVGKNNSTPDPQPQHAHAAPPWASAAGVGKNTLTPDPATPAHACHTVKAICSRYVSGRPDAHSAASSAATAARRVPLYCGRRYHAMSATMPTPGTQNCPASHTKLATHSSHDGTPASDCSREKPLDRSLRACVGE